MFARVSARVARKLSTSERKVFISPRMRRCSRSRRSTCWGLTQDDRVAPSNSAAGVKMKILCFTGLPQLGSRPALENHEAGPAILSPAVFAMFLAHRNLFAVTDRRQPLCGNAERREKFTRRLRPLGAQRQIVLVGAAFIAVAFDLDFRRRIAF